MTWICQICEQTGFCCRLKLCKHLICFECQKKTTRCPYCRKLHYNRFVFHDIRQLENERQIYIHVPTCDVCFRIDILEKCKKCDFSYCKKCLLYSHKDLCVPDIKLMRIYKYSTFVINKILEIIKCVELRKTDDDVEVYLSAFFGNIIQTDQHSNSYLFECKSSMFDSVNIVEEFGPRYALLLNRCIKLPLKWDECCDPNNNFMNLSWEILRNGVYDYYDIGKPFLHQKIEIIMNDSHDLYHLNDKIKSCWLCDYEKNNMCSRHNKVYQYVINMIGFKNHDQ